jgi:hypothetical protein
LRDATNQSHSGQFWDRAADVASVEFYGPGSGSWVAAAGNPVTPRNDHTLTLLPGGRVLVAGGFSNRLDGAGNTLASAELYDPGMYGLAWFSSLPNAAAHGRIARPCCRSTPTATGTTAMSIGGKRRGSVQLGGGNGIGLARAGPGSRPASSRCVLDRPSRLCGMRAAAAAMAPSVESASATRVVSGRPSSHRCEQGKRDK